MAVHTVRTDDLTGEPDAKEVVIVVNGKGIEIDLGERSAARLTKALEPFWKVGSEGDYDVKRKLTATRRRAATNGAVSDAERAAIRAWAADNGIEVGARGRIPADLVKRYRAR